MQIRQIKTTQITSVIKGGPGYTKFGHGRHQLKISKYAYFWYSFLFIVLVVSLFFDAEHYLFKGFCYLKKFNRI